MTRKEPNIPPPTLTERIAAHTTPHITLETILATNDLDGDRLIAIVHKAITDELTKRRAHEHFPRPKFEDLRSQLIEVAIGLAYDHDPTRSTLSLRTRIYRTCRLRTISAMRDRIRDDNRRGETPDHNDTDSGFDLEDFVVTRAQREAWAAAANRAGLTLAGWLIVSLDAAAALEQAA